MSFHMELTTLIITLIILGTLNLVKILMELLMSQGMFSKDILLSIMPALINKKKKKKLSSMMNQNSIKHSIEMILIVQWTVKKHLIGIKLKVLQVQVTTLEGSIVQQELSTILANTSLSIKEQFKMLIQLRLSIWGLKKQQFTLSILKDDVLKA